MVNTDILCEPSPEIHQLIGRIASSFARLEFLLDMLTAIMFHKAGGSANRPDLPISLKQKTQLIARCLRDFRSISEFRALGLGIMVEVNKLSDERNWILHGMFWSEATDEKKCEFVKTTRHSPTLYASQKREFSQDRLIEVDKEIQEVSFKLLRFVLELGDGGLSLWVNKVTL